MKYFIFLNQVNCCMRCLPLFEKSLCAYPFVNLLLLLLHTPRLEPSGAMRAFETIGGHDMTMLHANMQLLGLPQPPPHYLGGQYRAKRCPIGPCRHQSGLDIFIFFEHVVDGKESVLQRSTPHLALRRHAGVSPRYLHFQLLYHSSPPYPSL